jgi:hypothetical protein
LLSLSNFLHQFGSSPAKLCTRKPLGVAGAKLTQSERSFGLCCGPGASTRRARIRFWLRKFLEHRNGIAIVRAYCFASSLNGGGGRSPRSGQNLSDFAWSAGNTSVLRAIILPSPFA